MLSIGSNVSVGSKCRADEECEPEIIERTGEQLPDDAERQVPRHGLRLPRLPPELCEEMNTLMLHMHQEKVRS